MTASYGLLDIAKAKLLSGDYKLASSYYERALSEGVPSSVVSLRYLTKNYLVYPLEYETSVTYFDCVLNLRYIADKHQEYEEEYVAALRSLVDIKRMFLRSVSLFYFSDIAVCSWDSVIVREIAELQGYIRDHKQDILANDIYGIKKYLPQTDLRKLAYDLNAVEAFCMNILLTYTAEQHSVYQGKRYSALTVDYGYFYSTEIRSHDQYYNYANIKPRLHMLGMEAYYDDMLAAYKNKLREMGGFDSPKVLREELTKLIEHKDKSDKSAKDFIVYAKLFEKQDYSRKSLFSTLNKFNPVAKLNIMNLFLKKDYVGSFELDEYFPRKRFMGVCSMLSAGQGWQIDTVRWITLILCCFAGLGVIAYLGLAVAVRMGYYFGVNIEKH